MKVSSILVISVILNLHNRVIFIDIFGLKMKVSSILAISVITKQLTEATFKDTYRFNTRVSSSSVTSVNIKSDEKVSWKNTQNQNTRMLQRRNLRISHQGSTNVLSVVGHSRRLTISTGTFLYTRQKKHSFAPSVRKALEERTN